MIGSIFPKSFHKFRKQLNFPTCEQLNRIFLKFREQSCLLFTSSIKYEIKKFHVVVAQRRQRNGQKSVMHEQSCCFAHLNYCFFFGRSRCRYNRRCTSPLLLLLPTSPPREDARLTRWHYTTNIEARYIVRY